MKILFIPVSSPKGIGEYMRSRILADYFKQEWPSIEVHFALSKEAPYVSDCPYPVLLTDRSPTFHTQEVNEYIKSIEPDLVIFDASGRRSQLACAKNSGAKVVYIAYRDKKIRTAMRISRLINTDLIWIAQPEFLVKKLNFLTKLKLKFLKKIPPIFLGSVYINPNENSTKSVLKKYQLTKGEYVFSTSGGGGHYFDNGESASSVFYEAVKTSCGNLKRVQVWGGNYKGVIPHSDEKELNLKVVDNLEMMVLLSNAKFALTNGGDTILQALSLQVPLVAVAIAKDQLARINTAYAYKAAFLKCKPDILDISKMLVHIQNNDVRHGLCQKMIEMNVSNGNQAARDQLKMILGDKLTNAH